MKKFLVTILAVFLLASPCLFFGCGGGGVSVDEVSLNRQQILINVAEKFQLAVKVNGENANSLVSYKNDDDTVATVSESGEIVGVTEGSTILIVTSEGGGFASCHIVVYGEIEVPLTALTVTGHPANNQIATGASVQLSVAPVPSNANNYYSLVWYSDNTQVLRVDSTGLLTALSAGEANITVSANGTYISKTITITVVAA